MKHTPGMWTATRDEAGEDFDLASGPVVLGTVYGSDSFPCADDPDAIDAESAANARLIAASPQLLSSLQELIAARPFNARWYETDTELASIYHRAFDALADATGENPR